MSEQSSQEREIERPFLETKRILAGTAAAVQASSVSVSPGSGDWGPSPACTARHRLEQRQKLDRQRRESYTTCAVTTGAQTTIGQFSGNIYLECITARSCMIYTCQGGQVSGFLPCPVNNADSKVRGNTK